MSAVVAVTPTVNRPLPARPHWRLPWRGGVLTLGERTLLMGVLNVTPDSFSDGGQFLDPAAAVTQALALQTAGADIIDVGGESSRPGAIPVSAAEELQRLLPVITALTQQLRIPISVDTTKAVVARAAWQAGAAFINDITALQGDPDMAAVVADTGAPIILMHMVGTPQMMQQDPHYDDVVAQVSQSLREAVERAVAAGVDRARILLDPGIGFGKTLAHNVALLAQLPALAALGHPLVVGPSRKSFIGQLTGQAVGERLWGTAGAVAIAAWQGAAIVRVHDVSVMRDVVRVVDGIAVGRT